MCGRFYVDDEMANEMKKIFVKIDQEKSIPKKGEVCPSEQALIVCQKTEANMLMSKIASFGYKNPYQKNALYLNAKCETITEKPTFCYDFYNSRCIIPARGYYEWNKKDKYYFGNSNQLLVMAGIFRKQEFVILTTEANGNVIDIHDRMPLLLTPDEAYQWIGDLHQATQLLRKQSEIEFWEKIS